MATTLVVGTAAHEIEGNIKGIDVGVVTIIDQGTTMLTFLHLQSHRYWLQERHSLIDILGRETELTRDDGTDDGVGDRSLINERKRIAVFLTFIYIGDDGEVVLLLDVLDEERSLSILLRPIEFLALIVVVLAHHLAHYLIITIIDDGLSIMEEDDLLTALRLQRLEVFLMGRTQVSKHGDGRLDDVTKSKHLARLTDTSLEDTHLGLLVHQPDRQRHTYLGIVAAWAASDKHGWREQLVEPLLDHRLAIGTRDADNRDIELITMTFSQALQSLQRVDHLEEVGLRIVGGIALRHISYYEISDTTAIQLWDVVVTVISL